MKPGSCQIHLMPDALDRAWTSLYNQAVEANDKAGMNSVESRVAAKASLEDFTGPHFKDCVDSVDFLTPGWVHVGLTDGTMYSYPTTDVARVKSYRSPE